MGSVARDGVTKEARHLAVYSLDLAVAGQILAPAVSAVGEGLEPAPAHSPCWYPWASRRGDALSELLSQGVEMCPTALTWRRKKSPVTAKFDEWWTAQYGFFLSF